MQGVEAVVAEKLCSGADPASVLPTARLVTSLASEKTGFVSGIHAGNIGRAACALGAGRQAPDDKLGD
jgi:thymidine phosphorylase